MSHNQTYYIWFNNEVVKDSGHAYQSSKVHPVISSLKCPTQLRKMHKSNKDNNDGNECNNDDRWSYLYCKINQIERKKAYVSTPTFPDKAFALTQCSVSVYSFFVDGDDGLGC